ncbi:cell division protein FtsQ/DivIB [Nocardioides marmoraquaticus]
MRSPLARVRRGARLPSQRRSGAGASGAERVPTSTGPDEQTVRLARDDFARRRKAGRRRRWRTVALALLVVVVVGAAGWLVLGSPYLLAERTRVDGAGEVGQGRVVSAADVPVGVPLARVDLDAVRQRVEAIPAVESADVSRSWPHTVRVQVTPRTPVARVAGGTAPEGEVAVLDASGTTFAAAPVRAEGLPEVRLADGVDAEGVTEAAAVVSALPADLGRRVATVDVASVDEVVLGLRGGRTVQWGSAEQSATKAEVLGVLLAQVPRSVDEVDVSVPGRPTTR